MATKNKSSKGFALVSEAEKALKRWTLFGIGSEAKYEDAAELFTKAATQFKLAKMFDNAGKCHKRAAEALTKNGQASEASSQWREAGKSYALDNDSKTAKECFDHAIQGFLDNDRLGPAAKLYEEIAKSFVSARDWKSAIDAYKECADIFIATSDPSSANKRKIEIAKLEAREMKNYRTAIDIYEEVARANVDHQLLRWSVKNHLFHASLCQLAMNSQKKGGMSVAAEAFEKYVEMSDIFSGAREAKFVQELIEACRDRKVEVFQDAIFKFDNISPLDDYQTTLLHVALEEIKTEKAPNLLGADESKEFGGDDDIPNLLG